MVPGPNFLPLVNSYIARVRNNHGGTVSIDEYRQKYRYLPKDFISAPIADGPFPLRDYHRGLCGNNYGRHRSGH